MDSSTYYIQDQVSGDRYNEIMARYKIFLENANQPGKPSVPVFDPLPKKLVEQLALIRECSKQLQTAKDSETKNKNTPDVDEENESGTSVK